MTTCDGHHMQPCCLDASTLLVIFAKSLNVARISVCFPLFLAYCITLQTICVHDTSPAQSNTNSTLKTNGAVVPLISQYHSIILQLMEISHHIYRKLYVGSVL